MSLIEVIVALFIFSMSVFFISEEVNTDILGIKKSQNQIAEIYDEGI